MAYAELEKLKADLWQAQNQLQSVQQKKRVYKSQYQDVLSEKEDMVRKIKSLKENNESRESKIELQR